MLLTEYGDHVIGDDVEGALSDYVHLPADVSLLADVVAGTVDLGLQPQQDLQHEPDLEVGEQRHLLQRLYNKIMGCDNAFSV